MEEEEGKGEEEEEDGTALVEAEVGRERPGGGEVGVVGVDSEEGEGEGEGEGEREEEARGKGMVISRVTSALSLYTLTYNHSVIGFSFSIFKLIIGNNHSCFLYFQFHSILGVMPLYLH